MRHRHWQKGFFDLEVSELTEEAVEFVRQNITEDNYPVPVAFSGGKDSICTAKIMELSGIPYQLNYGATGIDPPEVVKFIKKHYPDCVFWKPDRNFWKCMFTMMPPTMRIRWCCNYIKKNPQERAMAGKSQVILGLRAEESSKRANRGRISSYKKRQTLHPIIFFWKEWQLWEFVEYHKLDYPALYDEGFDRIGCIICPFHSDRNKVMHSLYRERWPSIFKVWEKKVKKLWYLRAQQGYDMNHNSPEEYLEDWYTTGNPYFYVNKKNEERKDNQDKLGLFK